MADLDGDMINEAFGLANDYQQGFLPYAGGTYDQPNRLMAMIEAVLAVKREGSK